jgi:uroporphyrinogen-III synthase
MSSVVELPPLHGRSIVVTRPEHQAEEFADRIRALGGIPLLLPAIRLVPPEDTAPLHNALKEISTYDWLILTSVNGVKSVLSAMRELGINSAELSHTKIAAIGPATAKAVEDEGLTVTAVPDEYISESVLEVLGEVKNLRILLPRADIARKVLPERLQELGATVDEIVAYRILENDDPTLIETIRAFSAEEHPDYITCTSSSNARGVHALLKNGGKEEWFQNVPIVSIGPITARTVAELGANKRSVASVYTTDGVLDTIIELERKREEGNG